jgi:hypothetical protein
MPNTDTQLNPDAANALTIANTTTSLATEDVTSVKRKAKPRGNTARSRVQRLSNLKAETRLAKAATDCKVARLTSHQADTLAIKAETLALFGAKARAALDAFDFASLTPMQVVTAWAIWCDKMRDHVKKDSQPLVNIDFGGLATILRENGERESRRAKAEAALREIEGRPRPTIIDLPTGRPD